MLPSVMMPRMGKPVAPADGEDYKEETATVLIH